MQKLNLPEYYFHIRKIENDKQVIFDMIRKKEVLLTPEEWVRQHIVRFLIENRQFPVSLISVESLVKINRLKRRFDILVFDRKGNALLLVECKAPGVTINQETFDQISAYNYSLKAPYLLITNGIKHYFCKINLDQKNYQFIENVPEYNMLLT